MKKQDIIDYGVCLIGILVAGIGGAIILTLLGF